MKTFHRLLAIALVGATANNFVWFALTYWAYLTTKSVVSTSILAGLWLVSAAVSGIWFGSIVDHSRKKNAMLGSSAASLAFFALGLVVYVTAPAGSFASVADPRFWIFAMLLMCGTVAGMIYAIALPTLIAMTVPEPERAKANGLFGTIMGVSFALTSVISGFGLAYGGMQMVLTSSILAIAAVVMPVLAMTRIEEKEIVHTAEPGKG